MRVYVVPQRHKLISISRLQWKKEMKITSYMEECVIWEGILFPYDYRQKIDNVAKLQIIDDKKDYRFFFCW